MSWLNPSAAACAGPGPLAVDAEEVEVTFMDASLLGPAFKALVNGGLRKVSSRQLRLKLCFGLTGEMALNDAAARTVGFPASATLFGAPCARLSQPLSASLRCSPL
jgi:hypothetical protein